MLKIADGSSYWKAQLQNNLNLLNKLKLDSKRTNRCSNAAGNLKNTYFFASDWWNRAMQSVNSRETREV